MARTWVLTGSLEKLSVRSRPSQLPPAARATRDRGFRVIGAKQGRRRMAETIEPGDRIAFYVTGVQAFGGIVRVTGELYEDRTPVWPGKPGNPSLRSGPSPSPRARPDPYPWRFPTEPELVLEEHEFVPAVELVGELEHIRKWPAAHWHLAFQGQLRAVSEHDADLLERRLREGARAPA